MIIDNCCGCGSPTPILLTLQVQIADSPITALCPQSTGCNPNDPAYAVPYRTWKGSLSAAGVTWATTWQWDVQAQLWFQTYASSSYCAFVAAAAVASAAACPGSSPCPTCTCDICNSVVASDTTTSYSDTTYLNWQGVGYPTQPCTAPYITTAYEVDDPSTSLDFYSPPPWPADPDGWRTLFETALGGGLSTAGQYLAQWEWCSTGYLTGSWQLCLGCTGLNDLTVGNAACRSVYTAGPLRIGGCASTANPCDGGALTITSPCSSPPGYTLAGNCQAPCDFNGNQIDQCQSAAGQTFIVLMESCLLNCTAVCQADITFDALFTAMSGTITASTCTDPVNVTGGMVFPAPATDNTGTSIWSAALATILSSGSGLNCNPTTCGTCCQPSDE